MSNITRVLPKPVLYCLATLVVLALPTMASAQILVNSINPPIDNDGECSLQEALDNANSNLGDKVDCVPGGAAPDEIHFDVSVAGEIRLNQTLTILDPVIIEGPGSACNWCISIVPDAPGPPVAFGITTSGSTIRGLHVGGFQAGIEIGGGSATNNTIELNVIGVDQGGIYPGNSDGVLISGGASDNLVADNSMGGNGLAVHIQGFTTTGNMIEGNTIGGFQPNSVGVEINEASGNTIGGTTPGASNDISGNDTHGIYMSGLFGNTVQGNWITDNGSSGIRLLFCSDTQIGGTETGAGNVISGNGQAGLLIEDGIGVRAEGNFIGVDVTGTVGEPNLGGGVDVLGGSGNVIGGDTEGAGNVISANALSGVRLTNTSGNSILGNLIGRNATDTAALPNGQHGILITEGSSFNWIGELNPAPPFAPVSSGGGNVISGNGAAGIMIDTGPGLPTSDNQIKYNAISFNTTDGVAIVGESPGNAILSNAIFSNGGEGIDLGDDGVTPNDPGDADPGPNGSQNFPEILGAQYNPVSGELSVDYQVPSDAPFSAYPMTIEFFIADGDGQEGQVFLGSDTYTASGPKSASFVPNVVPLHGQPMVGTATDALGNTSEFAPPATLLPVELVSFEARVEGNDVLLSWQTASEVDNAGFDVQVKVQRSEAEGDWRSLSFVEGVGTTNVARTYSYRARDFEPGIWHFRLGQLDFDGAFEYSPVVEVVVELAGTHLLGEAYPNPFNPQTQFTLIVAEEQTIRVQLFDGLGRFVETLFDGHMSANVARRFTIQAHDLPSGTYIYRVVGETFAANGKAVLLK